MSKPWTWSELRDVVHEDYRSWPNERRSAGAIGRFIQRYPVEQQQAAALALSVAHWCPEEWCWLYEEQDIYRDACGLCALNFYSTGPDAIVCGECPLKLAGHPCVSGDKGGIILMHGETLWGAVREAALGGSYKLFEEKAAALYNELVRLYTEEWRKIYGNNMGAWEDLEIHVYANNKE